MLIPSTCCSRPEVIPVSRCLLCTRPCWHFSDRTKRSGSNSYVLLALNGGNHLSRGRHPPKYAQYCIYILSTKTLTSACRAWLVGLVHHPLFTTIATGTSLVSIDVSLIAIETSLIAITNCFNRRKGSSAATCHRCGKDRRAAPTSSRLRW